MKLKLIAPLPANSGRKKMSVNINFRGPICLSEQLTKATGYTENDKLLLAQSNENPKDWYITSHESGSTARMTKGRIVFNNSNAVRLLHECLEIDYSTSFKVAKEPVEIDGLVCWPIFVSSGIKKV